MRTLHTILMTGVLAGLLGASQVQAETNVTLKGLHICCTKCSDAITKAVDKVDGASVAISEEKTSTTVTANDDEAAKKAVGAIGRAGFYGTSDNGKIKIRSAGGRKKKGRAAAASAPKVTRLEIMGPHNCCPKCCKAIKEALGSVEGVAGDTTKPNAKSIVIEGNFSAQAVFQALNKAGFNARPKGAAGKRGGKKKKEATK